jgi:transposase-like protein
MSRQRRTFTPTFKREAASLVLDQGYICPEAARSHDVGESLLRRWVTQLQLSRFFFDSRALAVAHHRDQHAYGDLKVKILKFMPHRQ